MTKVFLDGSFWVYFSKVFDFGDGVVGFLEEKAPASEEDYDLPETEIPQHVIDQMKLDGFPEPYTRGSA